MHKFLIRDQNGRSYAPANHTGTRNRRIICAETVGARYLEILIGTIEKGQGAHPHAHPQLEQLGYILQGYGHSTVNGQTAEAGPGSWSYLPRGSMHSFTVDSDEAALLIVVYAPPYGESPALTVLPSAHAPSEALQSPLRIAMPVPEAGKTSLMPIITRATVNAQRVEVHLVSVTMDEPLEVAANARAEYALYVLDGELDVQIDASRFAARSEDWVYLPPSHRMQISHVAPGKECCQAFLFCGFEP